MKKKFFYKLTLGAYRLKAAIADPQSYSRGFIAIWWYVKTGQLIVLH